MNAFPNNTPPKLSAYLSGFILALLLTFLAFGLTKAAILSRSLTIAAISVLAVLQILVHLHYFLHLSFGPRHNLRLQAILFALFIIVIMVGGTLWIMHDLNVRMLPDSR